MQTENKKLYNYTQLLTEHFEHLITTCRTSTRQKKFNNNKKKNQMQLLLEQFEPSITI